MQYFAHPDIFKIMKLISYTSSQTTVIDVINNARSETARKTC